MTGMPTQCRKFSLNVHTWVAAAEQDAIDSTLHKDRLSEVNDNLLHAQASPAGLLDGRDCTSVTVDKLISSERLDSRAARLVVQSNRRLHPETQRCSRRSIPAHLRHMPSTECQPSSSSLGMQTGDDRPPHWQACSGTACRKPAADCTAYTIPLQRVAEHDPNIGVHVIWQPLPATTGHASVHCFGSLQNGKHHWLNAGS